MHLQFSLDRNKHDDNDNESMYVPLRRVQNSQAIEDLQISSLKFLIQI